jgi:hypothetical protein
LAETPASPPHRVPNGSLPARLCTRPELSILLLVPDHPPGGDPPVLADRADSAPDEFLEGFRDDVDLMAAESGEPVHVGSEDREETPLLRLVHVAEEVDPQASGGERAGP